MNQRLELLRDEKDLLKKDVAKLKNQELQNQYIQSGKIINYQYQQKDYINQQNYTRLILIILWD